MTNEIVLSPIHYSGKDVSNADFWKECYHEDEISLDEIRSSGKKWYKCYIKFNGIKPVQITKVEKI